ncbi:hypothetical protein AgCh_031644 [Apium graveolens]
MFRASKNRCTVVVDMSISSPVDAVKSALNSMGFKEIEIVVAEIGLPYKGDPNEVGPSVDNVKAYNGNLINHLRSNVGTPLMLGKSVNTYIFALYDENLKPGPGSERAFGLYKKENQLTPTSLHSLFVHYSKIAPYQSLSIMH